MGEFSLTHLLLLSLIFLVFFGPSRLPQLGQSLGKAIRGFKQGLTEIDVDAKDIQDKPLNQTQQMPQAQQQMPHTQTSSQAHEQPIKQSTKGDA